MTSAVWRSHTSALMCLKESQCRGVGWGGVQGWSCSSVLGVINFLCLPWPGLSHLQSLDIKHAYPKQLHRTWSYALWVHDSVWNFTADLHLQAKRIVTVVQMPTSSLLLVFLQTHTLLSLIATQCSKTRLLIGHKPPWWSPFALLCLHQFSHGQTHGVMIEMFSVYLLHLGN